MGFWSNLKLRYKTWKFNSGIREEVRLLDHLEKLIDGENIEAAKLKASLNVVRAEGDHKKRAMRYMSFRNELGNFEHFEHYIEELDKKLYKIIYKRLQT